VVATEEFVLRGGGLPEVLGEATPVSSVQEGTSGSGACSLCRCTVVSKGAIISLGLRKGFTDVEESMLLCLIG
jgi:NAD(P)H-nitrite reductase large subunit